MKIEEIEKLLNMLDAKELDSIKKYLLILFSCKLKTLIYRLVFTLKNINTYDSAAFTTFGVLIFLL